MIYEKEISENVFYYSEIPISDLMTLRRGEPSYEVGEDVFVGNSRNVIEGKVEARRYYYQGNVKHGVGRWQYLVQGIWYEPLRIDKNRSYIESCL